MWLVITLISNILIVNLYNPTDKSHNVDINRIMHEINSLNWEQRESITLDTYKHIDSMQTISSNESEEFLSAFFDGQDVKQGMQYTIRTVHKYNELIGYVRFQYAEAYNDHRNELLIFMNMLLIIVAVIITLLLIYIRQEIINPFNTIKELPYELSKGHLQNPPVESKNRFFGKFIWGLDLLRESLEQHKQKSLKLEKEKKMLILSISHDIKTPLSAIKLYAKAIREGIYNHPDQLNQATNSIDENVTKIEGFVSELMKMSTTDIVDVNVSLKEFYLKELILLIANTFMKKLDLLKIDFQIDSYQDILLVGDLDRLIEVFENIIENAIKYGDGQYIRISFATEDYCQLITLTNSGSTLSNTESVHMFDSFWRGSNAKDKAGNGLGLYICKQIMCKMDGDIYAQNGPNETSITVVIRQSYS